MKQRLTDDAGPIAFDSARPSVSHNVALALAAQLLPAFAAVLCMPHLARLLGNERLGILSIIWIIIGYFSILDLGMSVAVTRSVAGALAQKDQRRAAELFWSAVLCQLAVGTIGALIALSSISALISHVLRVPISLVPETRLALVLCSVAMPAVLVSSSVIGLVQATQRFDQLALVQIPASTAQYVLPLLCCVYSSNLAGIVAFLLAVRFIATIANMLNASRLIPGLFANFTFGGRELGSLFQFGSWITISNIVSPFQVYMDRFFVAGVVGASAVAYYSVPQDAAMRVVIFPASVVSAVFPAMSAAVGTDSGRMKYLTSESLRAILACMCMPILAVASLSHEVMRMWMGPMFASQSADVLSIILIGVLMNSVTRVPQAALNAAGRPDVLAKLQAIELPFQIAITWGFLHLFGLRGAASAWSLRLAFEMVVLFYCSRRLAGVSYGTQNDGRFRFGLILVLIAALALAFVSRTQNAIDIRIVAELVIFGLGCICSWFFLLSVEGRRTIGMRVLHLASGLRVKVSQFTGSL